MRKIVYRVAVTRQSDTFARVTGNVNPSPTRHHPSPEPNIAARVTGVTDRVFLVSLRKLVKGVGLSG
jgi:hypothetical protein